MKVVTAEEMRRIDRVAIEERGVDGYELMKRAGAAIAQAVLDFDGAEHILVLAGKGNNGGDGFVAARLLRRAGRQVRVLCPLGLPKSGDARRAFEDYNEEEVEPSEAFDVDALGSALDWCDVALDALLGTGAKPPLRAPLDDVVRQVNASGLPVVAADLPTGLDADNGGGDLVLRAACTVTIGLPKLGMLTAAGRRTCGAVRVEPILFPPDLLEDPTLLHETLLEDEAARLLPGRPTDGHKGTFGTATVCAGSRVTPGAALLCGEGALRGGAGLVRLHVPSALRDIMTSSLPETLASPWDAGESDLGPLSVSDMAELLDNSDALAIGPGIGTSPRTEEFLGQLLEARARLEERPPVVLDADALNLLARRRDWRALLDEGVVLTPHPGEAARLLDSTAKSVQSDRWAAASRLAADYGCIVVLKGWGTLVARAESPTIHVPAGNSALSRGGSGDVLTGLLAGILAGGCGPSQAACLACFVHGLAADLATRDRSPRGLRLQEITARIPEAFRRLEKLQSAQGPR